MSESSSPTPPPETPEPEPIEDAEVTVGPVNVAFTPLEPEDIVPSEPSPPSPPAEEPANAEAAAASPPPLQTAADSNNIVLGCLRDILVVLLSMLLAAAFVFAILFAINGTLMLNDREKTTQLALEQARMKNDLADARAQINTQKNAIATLDARVTEMEKRFTEMASAQDALTGRIDALQARTDEIEQAAEADREKLSQLQSQQQGMAEDVAALDDRIGQLEDEVQGIQTDLADFQKVKERFNRFVDGLTRLIADVAVEKTGPQPVETPASASPSPATPEATTPITPTLTITPTAITPPAETPTPSPTPLSETLKFFPPAVPLPTPAFDRGVVYGLVWNDADGDGEPDAGEEPIRGAVVTLKTARGRALLNMVTGADGRFAFVNVPPGAYQVELIPTADMTPTIHPARQIQVQGGDSVEVNFGIQ